MENRTRTKPNNTKRQPKHRKKHEKMTTTHIKKIKKKKRMIDKNYKFTFIDLFAGIGGIRIPFEELGGKCVFSSEWDESAQKMYQANFDEIPEGDITKIHINKIPQADLLLAGFPCQPFSIIGKGEGFADTRGTLFFDIERILLSKKPKAFLLENVKRLVSHDRGQTFKTILSKLKQAGYNVHWHILNALDYNLPQKRERTIIVGFRQNVPFKFPSKSKMSIKLKEIIIPHKNVPKKYFASNNIKVKRLGKIKNKSIPRPGIWHENKSGNIGINNYSCALRSGASHNYLLVDGIRRLTPREQLRLQGFPEDFIINVSDSEMKKLTGNSVPINMIRAVAKEIIKSMNPLD